MDNFIIIAILIVFVIGVSIIKNLNYLVWCNQVRLLAKEKGRKNWVRIANRRDLFKKNIPPKEALAQDNIDGF